MNDINDMIDALDEYGLAFNEQTKLPGQMMSVNNGGTNKETSTASQPGTKNGLTWDQIDSLASMH